MNQLISRHDIFLANTSYNSAKIAWRYCQFVPNVSPIAEKPTPRKLVFHLYHCPLPRFNRSVDYAEAYLMNKIRNMDNIQGSRIVGQAAAYVYRRRHRGETPIIRGMVDRVSMYTGRDISVSHYAAEHFRKQRVFMTEIKDCVEVLASVFAYNIMLNETEGNRYYRILAFNNPILSPGRPVVVATFVMRQLMLLSDLEADLEEIDEAEGPGINAAFHGLGI